MALLLFALPVHGAEDLLVRHGSRQRPAVALTFDLCQTPGRPAGYDRGVIAALRVSATPATFFVGGDWMRSHPQETRELAAESLFELGNHSWSHPDLRRLAAPDIVAEIERTEAELQRQVGRTPRLFRLPFGYYTPEVLQAVAATGVRIIQWDVVSGDPDPKLGAEVLVRTVTGQARAGSIVVMHANGRGRHTAEALPGIIAGLRRRGFQLVTVSQLLAP